MEYQRKYDSRRIIKALVGTPTMNPPKKGPCPECAGTGGGGECLGCGGVGGFPTKAIITAP